MCVHTLFCTILSLLDTLITFLWPFFISEVSFPLKCVSGALFHGVCVGGNSAMVLGVQNREKTNYFDMARVSQESNTNRYNTIQYNTNYTIQCNAMQCNAMQCNTNTIQYNTIQIQYNTIQYNTNTIQYKYNTIQYNTVHKALHNYFIPCLKFQKTYGNFRKSSEISVNSENFGNTSNPFLRSLNDL